MRLTRELFIKRAKEVHGEEYDYSLVEYKNTKTKVKIICPRCGMFEQTPEKHMMGRGCPRCAQQRLEETNLRKYGCRRPLQNEACKEKSVKKQMMKYGVANPMHREDVKAKLRETNRERYGVDYTCQADSVKAQREATNQERYGGASPFCSADVREKAKQTLQERYGVDNASKIGKETKDVVG